MITISGHIKYNFRKAILPVFFIFLVIFFPFDSVFLGWQKISTGILFRPLFVWILSLLDCRNFLTDFSSDSIFHYLLVLFCFFIAFPVSWLLIKFVPWETGSKVLEFIRAGLLGFLSLVLISYGSDKIISGQFPHPPPNILYAQVGMLDRDILFWSITGLSPEFCFITGGIQIVCGALLLFRIARLPALFASVFITGLIASINIGFDISVKLFSVTLVGISLYLFLFNLKENTIVVNGRKVLILNPGGADGKWIRMGLCVLLLLGTLFEKFDLLKTKWQSPFMSDAYRVAKGSLNGMQLNYLFIHPDGWLIAEGASGSRKDYFIRESEATGSILLSDYSKQTLTIRKLREDSVLILLSNSKDSLILKPLDSGNLPANIARIHFWVEEGY